MKEKNKLKKIFIGITTLSVMLSLNVFAAGYYNQPTFNYYDPDTNITASVPTIWEDGRDTIIPNCSYRNEYNPYTNQVTRNEVCNPSVVTNQVVKNTPRNIPQNIVTSNINYSNSNINYNYTNNRYQNNNYLSSYVNSKAFGYSGNAPTYTVAPRNYTSPIVDTIDYYSVGEMVSPIGYTDVWYEEPALVEFGSEDIWYDLNTGLGDESLLDIVG